MNTLVRRSIYLFSIIFILSVLFIVLVSFIFPNYDWTYAGLFVGPVYHYLDIPATMLLFSIIVLLFFVLLMHFFSQLNGIQLKIIAALLWSAVLLIEVLIIGAFRGILPPSFDGGHTYIQAINLLEHRSMTASLPYFQIYPNNIAITVVRFWIYRIFCFGHPDSFILADQITCVVALDIGIYFTWKFILSAMNQKMANLFLVLTLTCFPLLFYIVYFYTDSVTILFPSIVLYLTYRFSKTGKFRYLVIIAILLAVSYQIRENMVLMLPALILYLLLSKRLIKTLLFTLVAVIFLAGFGAAAQNYEASLGFTGNPALKMPATSWLLMGLSGNGRYNLSDYHLSLDQPTQQKKNAVDLQAIKNRIENKKLSGLSMTWAIKAARTFGDGSQGYFWYTTHNSNYSTAYDYLFGNRKQLIIYIIQIIHIVEFVLLAFSALRLFRTKKYDENLFIQICLFGSFLFYIFIWEAEPRYSLLFTLLGLAGAAYGIEELYILFSAAVGALKSNRLYSVAAAFFFISLLGMTIGVAAGNYETYTQTKYPEHIYSAYQPVSKGVKGAPVDKLHQIEQTFRTAVPFTRVQLGIKSCIGRALYQFTIKSAGHAPRIYGQKTVNGSQLTANSNELIPINRSVINRGQHVYLLTVRQISGSPRAELLLNMNGKGMYEQMDLYPQGALYVNHRIQRNIDLQFRAYTAQESPYLDESTYALLFLIPLLILTAGFFVVFKRITLPYKRAKLSID